MIESFWRSWSADYLTALLPRKKWHKVKNEVKLDQIVLVKEDDSPPSQWKMGRIVELLPSRKDEISRSVVIKMSNGKKLTRAVQKICILPTEEEIDIVPMKLLFELPHIEVVDNNKENTMHDAMHVHAISIQEMREWEEEAKLRILPQNCK